ncbi:MAG: O-antigen ligase family protein [Chloroflexi bacterium]|nr:O-antigen ligase family protein [Chloroflexota bacterium]
MTEHQPGWPATAVGAFSRHAQLAEGVCLLTAIVVPVLINPWGGSAFELPKAAFVRAAALVLIVLGLPALVSGLTRFPKLPPLAAPALALGAAALFSTFSSVDTRVSLLGLYERQQGLITLLAYLMVFLAAAASMRTPDAVDRLRAALVGGSVLVVAYGLIQAAHLDPLPWQTDSRSALLATIGRSNLLGSYLVLVMPLTLWHAASLQRAVGWRRWWPRPLLAGQLLVLLLTDARAAWLGLAVAALVGILAWLAPRRAPLAVPAVVLMAAFGTPLAGLAMHGSWPAVVRADGGSTAARLTIWDAAMPLVAARPASGYGPETFRSVFARVYPPQLVYYQGRQAAVDRAHNLWLDAALSSGVVGLFAFAWVLIAFTILLHRYWNANPLAWTALAAAVAAHIADMQFTFDLTASSVTFWLVLALASGLARVDEAAPALPVATNKRLTLWMGLSAALGLWLIWSVCVRPVLADAAYWQSHQRGAPIDARLAFAANAVSLWPLEPEYRMGHAAALLEAGRVAEADAELDAAGQQNPGDVRNIIQRGSLVAIWSNGSPERDGMAAAILSRAAMLAPTIAGVHTQIGIVLARQGQLPIAMQAFARAVDLDATDYVAYCYLGALYRHAGDEPRAQQAYQLAARWGGSYLSQLPCAQR